MDLVKELTELIEEMAKSKLPKVLAKFLWEYYKELVKVGFTPEEALRLLKLPDFSKT